MKSTKKEGMREIKKKEMRLRFVFKKRSGLLHKNTHAHARGGRPPPPPPLVDGWSAVGVDRQWWVAGGWWLVADG